MTRVRFYNDDDNGDFEIAIEFKCNAEDDDD